MVIKFVVLFIIFHSIWYHLYYILFILSVNVNELACLEHEHTFGLFHSWHLHGTSHHPFSPHHSDFSMNSLMQVNNIPWHSLVNLVIKLSPQEQIKWCQIRRKWGPFLAMAKTHHLIWKQSNQLISDSNTLVGWGPILKPLFSWYSPILSLAILCH